MWRLFLLLLLIVYGTSYGQVMIQGKVISGNDSLPIPGVTVTVKGTTLGTSTSAGGTFKLLLDDSVRKLFPMTLTMAFVGYIAREEIVAHPKTEPLLFVLKENSGGLVDVVVVGYGTEPKEDVVNFPWPPPETSARSVVSRERFSKANTLGELDGILTNALVSAGYTERSYYYIPNGFALVTRIEQISKTGEPLDTPQRWNTKVGTMRKLSWGSYLKSLFFSTPGYFRILVFAVTNKPFASSGKTIKKDVAIKWLSHGLNMLPEEIADKRFSKQYNCTALIYEFVKPESGEAFMVVPGRIAASDHLAKSNIETALRRK